MQPPSLPSSSYRLLASISWRRSRVKPVSARRRAKHAATQLEGTSTRFRQCILAIVQLSCHLGFCTIGLKGGNYGSHVMRVGHGNPPCGQHPQRTPQSTSFDSAWVRSLGLATRIMGSSQVAAHVATRLLIYSPFAYRDPRQYPHQVSLRGLARQNLDRICMPPRKRKTKPNVLAFCMRTRLTTSTSPELETLQSFVCK